LQFCAIRICQQPLHPIVMYITIHAGCAYWNVCGETPAHEKCLPYLSTEFPLPHAHTSTEYSHVLYIWQWINAWVAQAIPFYWKKKQT
jgi:hypothetical protein